MADNKYPESIMQAVRQNMGLEATDTSKDEIINKLPSDAVWHRFCTWHGFLGTWPENLHYAHVAIFGG